MISSDPTALRVEGTILSTCPADLDDGSGSGVRDGAVTIDDLLYFVAHYEGGC